MLPKQISSSLQRRDMILDRSHLTILIILINTDVLQDNHLLDFDSVLGEVALLLRCVDGANPFLNLNLLASSQQNSHHMTERTNVPRCPCLYLYLKKIYVFTQTHPAVLGKAEEDKGSQKIRKFRVSISISESKPIKNCNVRFYFLLQVRIGSRLIPNLSGHGFGSQLGSHQPTLTRCSLCKFFTTQLSQLNAAHATLQTNATCC